MSRINFIEIQDLQEESIPRILEFFNLATEHDSLWYIYFPFLPGPAVLRLQVYLSNIIFFEIGRLERA